MTARNGLFVANGTAGVTAPQDARLALAGLLDSFGATALDAGAGVLYGPGSPGRVTGSASGPNMKYTVAAGVFATLRGTSTDGLYVWANDGAVTLDSLTPAPGAGSRYDLIYARARNANDGFGDANSNTELGVTVGVASGSPVRPTAPAGALVLAESLVGTSIANASLATITQVAPWKVAKGAAIPVRSQVERDALTAYAGKRVFRLDLLTTEIHDGTSWGVGAPPEVQARATATQSLGSSVITPLTAMTVEYSSLAGFNAATGVWTCPVAGDYEVSGVMTATYNAAITRVACIIQKNGASLIQFDAGQAGSTRTSVGISPQRFPFIVGDTVQLAGFTAGAVGTTEVLAPVRPMIRIRRIT